MWLVISAYVIYFGDFSTSNAGVLLRVIDKLHPVTQRFSVCTWIGSLRKQLVKLLVKAPATIEWPSYVRGYHQYNSV